MFFSISFLMGYASCEWESILRPGYNNFFTKYFLISKVIHNKQSIRTYHVQLLIYYLEQKDLFYIYQ